MMGIFLISAYNLAYQGDANMFVPLTWRALSLIVIIFSLGGWGALVEAAMEEKPAGTMEQTPGAHEELTLERSIQLALSRNPQFLSSQEEIEAAENIRKRAWSQFFFKVKGTYSYTRFHKTPTLQFLEIPQVRDDIIGTKDNFNFLGVVEQPLFTGFSIVTQYELAKLGFNLAKVRYKSARLDLIRDVKTGFFSILRAEKGVFVAEQAVVQLKSQAKRARDFYEVGMTARNDYLKANVSLANAEQELTIARNAVDLTEADFATLLRLPVDTSVQVKDVLNYKPLSLKLDEAYKQAHANRPQIMEADLAVEAATKEVKLAQAGYYPNIALSFNYSKFGDTYKLDGSPFQKAEDWNVTTALNWTFWEWGSTKYQVEEKKSRVKQANHALQSVGDAVDLEVKRAFLTLREAEKNIGVAQTSIEEAEENYRMEVERYKQQVNTNTDVLEANFLLANARTNHYDALFRYNVAVAELQRAMGLAE
jgi:outer membrane protein TolC